MPVKPDDHNYIMEKINDRMKSIKNTIAVMSNKGGVGKSTVSVNIAYGLAEKNYRVGLLDADLHGPSIFKMVGKEDERLFMIEEQILPLTLTTNNIKVVSMAGFIENANSPIIWRGPIKNKILEQFLSDVEWGELDYLIVDLPPGTGDEPLSILQLIPGLTGNIIVTTPQGVATLDAQKAVGFLRKLNSPILGIIENMSGFICPHCNETINIFKKNGGKNISLDMNIPFLGELGIDPNIVECADNGQPFVTNSDSDVSKKQMNDILNKIIDSTQKTKKTEKKEPAMKIAIPLANNNLCLHFGHCEEFVIYEISDNKILAKSSVTPPAHAPGVIPEFLAKHNVNYILAGGMGSRAQSIFNSFGINVVTGVAETNPDNIINAFMNDSLESGENVCDH